MQKLVKKNLVNHLDFENTGKVEGCEACLSGNQCKNRFSLGETVTTVMTLELVHSDLCGKWVKHLRKRRVLLTLLNDKSHYSWVYIPSQDKDQVFECFKKWQMKGENYMQTSKRVKTPWTSNGGELISKSFQAHLKTCGISHELMICKTQEQNGAADRLK